MFVFTTDLIPEVYEMWPVVGWGFVPSWVSFWRMEKPTDFQLVAESEEKGVSTMILSSLFSLLSSLFSLLSSLAGLRELLA